MGKKRRGGATATGGTKVSESVPPNFTVFQLLAVAKKGISKEKQAKKKNIVKPKAIQLVSLFIQSGVCYWQPIS